jgi:hypothetical protein
MTTKQVARSLECTRNRGRVSGPGPSKQTRLRALVSDACPRTTSAGCGSKHPEILRACSLRAREQPQNREGPGPGEREAEEHLRCELSCQGRRTPVDSGSHSQWSRSVGRARRINQRWVCANDTPRMRPAFLRGSDPVSQWNLGLWVADLRLATGNRWGSESRGHLERGRREGMRPSRDRSDVGHAQRGAVSGVTVLCG